MLCQLYYYLTSFTAFEATTGIKDTLQKQQCVSVGVTETQMTSETSVSPTGEATYFLSFSLEDILFLHICLTSLFPLFFFFLLLCIQRIGVFMSFNAKHNAPCDDSAVDVHFMSCPNQKLLGKEHPEENTKVKQDAKRQMTNEMTATS